MAVDALAIVSGVGLGLAVPFALTKLFGATTIDVDDEEAVLVTSHGKLVATLTEPGLVVFPSRILPWVRLHRVSLARDFREILNVHVNDASGTSVVIDLWVEFRIEDPQKALFSIDDWDKALSNVVSHSALSILGNRDFHEILSDRSELGARVREDVATETARWGLSIEAVMLRNVSLSSEVTRQVVQTVAARLERAKADVEEEGRLRVALLEAQTSARVAELVAEAKGQYPAAIGRALESLKKRPEVFAAYDELYELSLLRPHRTTAFVGFDGELRAVDAGMLLPPTEARVDRTNGE
jgi:regulator of protease activity HflC (stomatin/prohibitin superfamily)